MTAHNRLKEMLGDRLVMGNSAELSGYFRNNADLSGLGLACPETHEEVQKIVRYATETGTPVFTNYDKYLSREISGKNGVVIDFRKMKAVERTDAKNLIIHVQAGAEFDEIQKELKKENVKMAAPAGITTGSIVKNCVNRATIKSASKYPEPQISNMYAVLGDGRLHKTGSHALDEMASDTQDGAAFLSYWYLGARDTYGIITRGSIVLYPVWEKRSVTAFAFESLTGLLTAMRDLPRREIGIEYLGMDSTYYNKLTGLKGPQWILAVGFDGYEAHVNWQEKAVRELADKMGGRENPDISEKLLDKIDYAWPVHGSYNTEFMTQFSRASGFDEIIGNELSGAGFNDEDFGRLFIAIDRGRSVSCIYEYYRDEADTEKFVDDLNIKIFKQGGYFDTPAGDLSESIFSSIDGYSKQLRRIKDMLDPGGILNPGILKY